jgi:hypothetical protein
VYYNQDHIKRREKDKRHHDLITALKEGPPNWGLHPQLATTVNRRGTSTENALKGGQPRRQPHPQPGPCPFCKGNHCRSKCPHLQMEGGVQPLMDWWVLGLLSMLHFLTSMLRSLWVAIMAEKWKAIYLLESGAHFFLTFLSWSPVQWQGYCSGHIQQASGVLFYLASDLLLGRTPLLSLLIFSETAVPLLGWDLLSPGNLFLTSKVFTFNNV